MKRPLLPLPLFLTSLVLASSVLSQTVLAQVVPAQTAPNQTAPLQTPAVRQNVKYVAVQKLVKVTTTNGKSTETLVDSPLTVVRGDVLHEEVSVQSVAAATLPQVVVSMPVPDGTAFTGEITPKTGRVKLAYSTDDGRNYFTAPQRMTRTTENGQTVMKRQAANLSEVTNVRWTIGALKPGETLKLTYRVRVN